MAPHPLRLGGQPNALVVGEPETTRTELLSKDAILGLEIVNHVALQLVGAAGEATRRNRNAWETGIIAWSLSKRSRGFIQWPKAVTLNGLGPDSVAPSNFRILRDERCWRPPSESNRGHSDGSWILPSVSAVRTLVSRARGRQSALQMWLAALIGCLDRQEREASATSLKRIASVVVSAASVVGSAARRNTTRSDQKCPVARSGGLGGLPVRKSNKVAAIWYTSVADVTRAPTTRFSSAM